MKYSFLEKITRFAGSVAFAALLLASGALPAQAAGLTSVQINAVLSLLQSFGVNQLIIANVQTAIGGTSVVNEKIASITGLSITASSLPSIGVTGEHYSATLVADGLSPDDTTGGYAWDIASGTLPPGLALNVASCSFACTPRARMYNISGTPTTVGVYTFTARISSATGTATKTFTITILQGSITKSTGPTCVSPLQWNGSVCALAATPPSTSSNLAYRLENITWGPGFGGPGNYNYDALLNGPVHSINNKSVPIFPLPLDYFTNTLAYEGTYVWDPFSHGRIGEVVAYKISKVRLFGNVSPGKPASVTDWGYVHGRVTVESVSDLFSVPATIEISNIPGYINPDWVNWSTPGSPTVSIRQQRYPQRSGFGLGSYLRYRIDTMSDAEFERINGSYKVTLPDGSVYDYLDGVPRLPPPDSNGYYYINVRFDPIVSRDSMTGAIVHTIGPDSPDNFDRVWRLSYQGN